MVYTLSAISLAYGLAFTIVCIFSCTSVTYIWESWDGEHKGKCINFHIFAWAHAGINFALDLVIIGVPIPELLWLSMSMKKKIQIILMFSVGALYVLPSRCQGIMLIKACSTTFISVIRLQSLVQSTFSTSPTYDNVPTAYWSVLEAFVGVFCVCMPAMRRFLAYVSPYCFGSTKADSSYEQYNAPNKLLNGMPRSSRVRSALKGSEITKTVDTQVESRNKDDDEVWFVTIQNGVQG
jgi:hypothetical protein